MNLHDLYARVCAKRPELAVKYLEHKPCWCGCGPRWILSRHLGSTHYPEDEDAAALILAKWVEALPELICIHKRSYGWIVGRGGSAHSCPPPLIAPTPIEALAAFYLEETT